MAFRGPARKKKRSFSPERKLQIVREGSALPDRRLGNLLRREGISYYLYSKWRIQVESAQLRALESKGPARRSGDKAAAERIEALKLELRAAREELEKANLELHLYRRMWRPNPPKTTHERLDAVQSAAFLRHFVGVDESCVLLGISRSTYYRTIPKLKRP